MSVTQEQVIEAVALLDPVCHVSRLQTLSRMMRPRADCFSKRGQPAAKKQNPDSRLRTSDALTKV
jgi:hypothetical protein